MPNRVELNMTASTAPKIDYTKRNNGHWLSTSPQTRHGCSLGSAIQGAAADKMLIRRMLGHGK